ncbi:MAG: sigma-54 dependent transcriptional regulator [Balneolales bacterium]|nr:sigma-54 dependent transcriptional regulator [Balneolales bacterium]
MGYSCENKPVLITQNPAMIDLYHKIKLIAHTKATVLITGENGTGKEVFAGLLHYHNSNKNRNMVIVNCGAIPNELVESELLGHEKGAFTGADTQKKGCFELAHEGTLFLDEIGEMSLNAQVKLLRAVELGSFRRIGGKEEIRVDVSLISATNKILDDQVKAGSFREDLYYRLNVVELYVPPLRHRKEDIPMLIEFYKNRFCELYDKPEFAFDEESLAMMLAYDWPGNVRELKNCVERCTVLFEGHDFAGASMLPASITKAKPKASTFYQNGNSGTNGNSESNRSNEFNGFIHIPVGTSLDEIERMAINQTLSSVDNNKTEAARILGFARKTLHNKLDKYESELYGTDI